MRKGNLLVASRFAACLLFVSFSGHAQSVEGSLVDLVNSGQYDFNRLERLAAVANQATYNELIARGCDDQAGGPTAACPESIFRVFSNVRELVQTARELLGPNSGAARYSLGLDEEGLGFALRWTAAEELSAAGSASAEFSKTQIASLMSRINALRYGASGFSIAGIAVRSNSDSYLTRNHPSKGGGASADPEGGIASRWGGFLDGSFGWGSREPTQLEDAFDYDHSDVTLGVDYRFTRQFVLGGIVGYSKQEIDFDSTQSVVDGGIKSKGFSLTAYGLYEWNGPYLSASLAFQGLSHDTTRVITYPSFNTDVEAVYATAYGSTDSRTVTGSLNLGWPISRGAFGIEPYLRSDYRNVKIDGFSERSVDNFTGGPAGFDFRFDSQSISSLDAALGAKIQYVFTPSFGVIVPFLRAEYHHNFDTDPTTVNAIYNGTSGSGFLLPSDERDSSYVVTALGTSVVLKFGWQAFFQYQRVESLKYLSSQTIAGGIRGEF